VDVKQIRTRSVNVAANAGIEIPISLPPLDESISIRGTGDAVDRLLVLNVVAAVTHGFERARALEWLRREELIQLMTPGESAFVLSGEGPPGVFQVQVEAMWALAWTLMLVPQLDFWKACDSRFVTMLPDLKSGQSGADWYSTAEMRSKEEVVEACDLAYCLHWAVRQAQLDGRSPPGGLEAHIVTERRRALEWLLYGEPWDAITLDT
jgi:hypothetical protein